MPGGSGANRRRAAFGVNAKLQLAFGAVAFLTVVAATVAIVSFSATEQSFHRIADRDVPVMTDAMRLSLTSGEMSTAAARFVSAKVAADQKTMAAVIAAKSDELKIVMARLRGAGGDTPAFAVVEAVSKRLDANLRALEAAISERSQLRADLSAALGAVHKAHARISEKLTPIVDDSYFDLVLQTEEAAKRPVQPGRGQAQNLIDELRNALAITAYSHLITSLIGEASISEEAASLVPIQERFAAAADHLTRASATLADGEIKKLAAALLAFGQGPASVFALRGKELVADRRADRTVTENTEIQRELDAAVSALVVEAEGGMKQGTAQLVRDLDRNRTLLVIVAIISVLVAAGIGVFYVQRRLIRRLTSIGEAMRRLSSGEVELAVPAIKDRDEIGAMARTLEVFRAGEIERRGLAGREQAEQAAQRARAALIEEMINGFRATVTGVIGAVTGNIARMETTARTLSTIAGEADQQARAVSVASEATSSNVHVVAAATEELGASIREISEQAAQANEVVARAAQVAQSTDQLVGQLADGANRIGDVVMLIRSIAEQTNLLALNATIEAARAGESGRGFAVVAAEVKTLAHQTAKATEEIAAQVSAIQGSTTETVEAIRSIKSVMDDIRRFAATIASAVEEQSVSTQEISRNVQQAAGGATELTANMTTVTVAIKETNRSASEVLEASSELTSQAGKLESAVDAFLRKVAAA
ncbi:MAG TPA: methyl-accepting chemotaxis protein [Xanthobacteraceae bacterium]|nr:methyl-accepting chemotaxis protein [Xanthobacteraceae bacterium]